MTTLFSLVAPQVVMTTTCGATADDKVVIMKTLCFPWPVLTCEHHAGQWGEGTRPVVVRGLDGALHRARTSAPSRRRWRRRQAGSDGGRVLGNPRRPCRVQRRCWVRHGAQRRRQLRLDGHWRRQGWGGQQMAPHGQRDSQNRSAE